MEAKQELGILYHHQSTPVINEICCVPDPFIGVIFISVPVHNILNTSSDWVLVFFSA